MILGHHHLDELFVVDLTITIDISFADHLIDFLVRQLLTQVGHDVPQLGGGNESISITIEDLLCREILVYWWLFCTFLYPYSNNARKYFTEQGCHLSSSQYFFSTLKASINSSSVSVSFIFRAIRLKNSGKSMVPDVL